MIRTALQGLFAHKVRLFTTALAVALGVSFMTGTLVLTDTVSRTFNDVFGGVYQGTDAVVRSQSVFTGPEGSGEQRARIDASLIRLFQKVPGVAVAEGSIGGFTRIVGKDGNALGNPANGAPTIGMNWTDNKDLNPMTLVAGTPPRADDEVVIDKKSADDGKLAVGDRTTVLVQGPPRQVRIAGIAKFGTADSPAGASITMFTYAAAERLVGEPGKVDNFSFVAAKGVSQQQLAGRLEAAAPHGLEAVTGKQLTKEAQDQVAQGLGFFNTFMLIFALVALLVGGFMIFNTFSITVAQRTRENGLLRALGASRRQVMTAVLLEALVIGLVASLIGLAVGVVVAMGLKALLAGVGFDIPAGGIVFAASTVVISLVVGVGVTLLSAISPARKAAKVVPVAAMQEGFVGSTGYGSKERIFVGAGLLVLGGAALVAGLFWNVGSALTMVGAGVLFVFFGVSVLGRTISLPLSRALGSPLPRLRGVTGELARENAMRNPKRTAASASALMIGVGVVGFITIFVASSKASMDVVVDRAFTGDFGVDSGAGMFGGVDPSLNQRISELPQVAASTGIRLGSAEVDGKVLQIAAADPRTAFKIVNVDPKQGTTQALEAEDAIAVHKDTAKSKHLTIGSTVPVLFKDTGLQRLRVALIYGEKQPAGQYLLGMPAYEKNFTNRFDTQIYVKKAPGVSADAALAAIKGVTADYPGTKVMDLTGMKAEMAKPLNQMLTLMYALLALAILIALMGIANTLALSIYERTRELGLLRAVGMTRSQLRSSIRWESVIIALQGTVLGLAIGMFFGWVLVAAMKDEGITVFRLPYTSLAVIVVLGALAGMAAAVLPGRRAARLDVLKAVVTE